MHKSEPVNFTIDLATGVPIYRQIVNQISYSIASGALRPGEELPPIRTLALKLKVTPNTVVKAYDELERAGVVQKRRGSGTYVSEARVRIEERERSRIIEERIEALLAEAHRLSFSVDDVVRLIRRRQSAMAHHPSAAAAAKER